MPLRQPMHRLCSISAGDLATMFVLEDRVTARTNSGENEPEGNPNNTPSASSVAGSIVETLAPPCGAKMSLTGSWAGRCVVYKQSYGDLLLE